MILRFLFVLYCCTLNTIKYALGELIPRITKLYVGFTYWENAGVVTKSFVCVICVTESYFLNGMCCIYDAVRW